MDSVSQSAKPEIELNTHIVFSFIKQIENITSTYRKGEND